ncbi:unnamed protein product, partial [Iphiclides podalirius]
MLNVYSVRLFEDRLLTPWRSCQERSEALSGRLSKSASELSCSSPAAAAPPPRARSAHHHTPLSVVHRTHHFFTNLKSRWQRSRSRERCPAGTVFSLAPGPDSSGTEYAADQSSEHSTPANSPRHRLKKGNPRTTVETLFYCRSMVIQ